MKWRNMIAAALLLVVAQAALASEGGEGGEGGEKKAKQPAKPLPDSAVSVILQLPEVQAWQHRIEAKENGNTLTAWGNAIQETKDGKCWEVAVARSKGESTKILKYFCVMQASRDILVEKVAADPLDGVEFMPYEDWHKACPPNAYPGAC